MEAYLIGTLYEEEEKDKKQNFYNQIARDEKGHKRFHGAFTGGFSAGYKNTCGSKEGWVPSQFISSRTSRAQYKPQSILQFMDEEDLGQTVAGQNLITHEGFSDTFGEKAQEQENTAFEQMKQVLGVEIPRELVISLKKDSVGMTILKNMKQISANNSNNTSLKIIGAQPPEKKHEFDPMKIIAYKDDFLGVGGENTKKVEETDWFSEQLGVLMRGKRQGKQENNQENEKEEKKTLKFTDFSENNEKEDYNDFEITHEDFEAIHEFSKERSQISKIKDVLGLYEKSSKPYILPLHKSSTKIPANYNAFYRLTQKPQETPGLSLLSSSRSRLTLDQRAALLEETSNNLSNISNNFPNTAATNKPLKQISEEKKRKILGVKQFVKGSAQDMEGDHIESIFKEKDKQARYLNFCYEKEGKVVGGIPPNSSLSLEQLQNEAKEFEQVYELFKNYRKEEFAEKNKEKPAIEHRRSFQQWVPEKLTCKRFGVPQPFQGKLAPLNQQKALIQRRNVFETEIRPLFEDKAKRTFEEAGIEEDEEVEGEVLVKKIKGEAENNERIGEQGPSLELFKSIFDAEDD